MNHTTQAQGIQLFIFDVDGVMTDGKLWFGPDGECLKAFHAHDGVALKRLQHAGITVAVISGRDSAPLRARMHALGITHLYLGVHDKNQAQQHLAQKTGIPLSATAYMGDDEIDRCVMEQAALAFAPPNAMPAIQALAHHITARPGGEGAVRDAVEQLFAWRDAPLRTQPTEHAYA